MSAHEGWRVRRDSSLWILCALRCALQASLCQRLCACGYKGAREFTDRLHGVNFISLSGRTHVLVSDIVPGPTLLAFGECLY